VAARAGRAAVQELLQVSEFFRGLEHPPITSRGYDIQASSRKGDPVSWPRCAAGEAG
jgi:hypothetical protein